MEFKTGFFKGEIKGWILYRPHDEMCVDSTNGCSGGCPKVM